MYIALQCITSQAPSPMLKLILFLIFTFLTLNTVSGQFYDTVHRPNLSWFEHNTEHFRIIFHEGNEKTALRAAYLLENDYQNIRLLTGGSLKNFPVIINSYNDRSNGYVSSFNFRMEIESPPIAGKSLNPRTGGHLENLMSHELVHALQFSVNAGYNRMLYVFSPDLGRSVHGFVPTGIIEGLAVYRETELFTDGGRGNHAPFMQQYYGNLSANRSWNLATHLTPASYSRPLSRHYIGGYVFTRWFIDTYGMEPMRRSIRSHALFPFLGYATNLWYTSGISPWKLSIEFAAFTDDLHNQTLERNTQTPVETIDLGRLNGPDIHQPQWISSEEIIYFGRFYNERSGFWLYNTTQNSHRLIAETTMHESYGYRYDPLTSTLLYARYHIHPYHENRYTSDIHQLNLTTLKNRQLTRNHRLHHPNIHNYGLLALRPYGHEYHLTLLPDSTQADSQPDFDSPVLLTDNLPGSITEIRVHPADDNLIAVIANLQGQQALWLLRIERNNQNEFNLVKPGTIAPFWETPPDVYFPGGIIFDPRFHPKKSSLLLSAEIDQRMQLVEYHYDHDQLTVLTDSPFGIMEASYHPDGNRIAAIVQDQNYRKLTILNSQDLLHDTLSTDVWKAPLEDITEPVVTDDIVAIPYQTGINWIRPRTLFPVSRVMSARETNSLGLVMSSADVLRRNAYSLEISRGSGKTFYEFSYTYAGFFPKIKIQSALLPFAPGGQPDGGTDLFGQEQIHGAGLPFNWYFDDPAGTTKLSVNPELLYLSNRIQVQEIESSDVLAASNWNTSARIRINASYAHRLRQNLRDMQPRSGINFYAQTDLDFMTFNDARTFNGLRLGIQTWLAPRMRSNESLQLGIELIRQNRFGYNLFNLIHDGFDLASMSFNSPDISVFSARYTIPLSFPERGGYLLPVYLESIYAVAFSETIANNVFRNPTTLIGGGIRARIRLVYNIPVDIGIGLTTIPGTSGSTGVLSNF